jgi:hypothetical protein
MKSQEPTVATPDWESGRREQLRRWAALPLRNQLQALEEMAELAERIQKAPTARATGEGKTESPGGRGA